MSARDEILTRVREAIAPASAPVPHRPREYRTRTTTGSKRSSPAYTTTRRGPTAFPKASWARRLVPRFAIATRAGSWHQRAYRKRGWWA